MQRKKKTITSSEQAHYSKRVIHFNRLFFLVLHWVVQSIIWRAVKISAAVAADNFGWLGGAPSVFRRRRRRMIPAGGGGAIRRLRVYWLHDLLAPALDPNQFGCLKGHSTSHALISLLQSFEYNTHFLNHKIAWKVRGAYYT